MLSGIEKGYYGQAHEIAVKLGLKREDGDEGTVNSVPAGQAKTLAVAFELKAHHTTCRFKKPLVIVSGLPGDGAGWDNPGDIPHAVGNADDAPGSHAVGKACCVQCAQRQFISGAAFAPVACHADAVIKALMILGSVKRVGA